jgi:hypothetical protein
MAAGSLEHLITQAPAAVSSGHEDSPLVEVRAGTAGWPTDRGPHDRHHQLLAPTALERTHRGRQKHRAGTQQDRQQLPLLGAAA